ncbi:MAG TPA: hypothetical protein VK953_09225 [Methylophilus sp.]|nr:hypothetical protein [Methylophilus sp.]
MQILNYLQLFVIPAEGVAGISQSMLCAFGTAGLCRSHRALQEAVILA